MGSYCLAVTQAIHCSEFRRTNCLIPNSQCPEKAKCYPFFIIILTFLLNSKRHPNIFLANQRGEFKTELNLNISLKSHRFTHIVCTRISTTPDYPGLVSWHGFNFSIHEVKKANYTRDWQVTRTTSYRGGTMWSPAILPWD